MHPLRFAKEHPVAVIVNMGLGMVIGPWILSTANRFTGIQVGLPSYGGQG